jgi:hypothetical protein
MRRSRPTVKSASGFEGEVKTMTLSPLADDPADPPDEQLVTLVQGGDRRALEQLR